VALEPAGGSKTTGSRALGQHPVEHNRTGGNIGSKKTGRVARQQAECTTPPV